MTFKISHLTFVSLFSTLALSCIQITDIRLSNWGDTEDFTTNDEIGVLIEVDGGYTGSGFGFDCRGTQEFHGSSKLGYVA